MLLLVLQQADDFSNQKELCLPLQRVYRPRGGYNLWLRWLPVQVHKRLDTILKHLQADWRRLPLVFRGAKSKDTSQNVEDETTPATKTHVEADAARIAAMAKDEFDRSGSSPNRTFLLVSEIDIHIDSCVSYSVCP